MVNARIAVASRRRRIEGSYPTFRKPSAASRCRTLRRCIGQTMKRKRHTEEQIIAILKEHDAGMKTVDLCRKHGISEASFYNWKAKYGGLEVSEAKRLKGLEIENAKLKKLLADAMLDNAALKDLLTKNGDARRQARGGRSPAFCVRYERAAGRAEDDGAVSIAQTERWRVAGSAASPGSLAGAIKAKPPPRTPCPWRGFCARRSLTERARDREHNPGGERGQAGEQ